MVIRFDKPVSHDIIVAVTQRSFDVAKQSLTVLQSFGKGILKFQLSADTGAT